MRWFVLCVMCGLLLWNCVGETPECSEQDPCAGDRVCVNGKCENKRCSVDVQCAFNEYCDSRTNQCKRKSGPQWTCRTDADCRPGESCEGGFCRLQGQEPTPTPDIDPNKCDPVCPANFRCENGSCVEIPQDPACKLDQDCETGLKCNFAVDRCQKPCQQDTDCETGRTCKDQFCQRQDEPECGPQKACTAPKTCQNGKCVDPEPECGPQKACTAPKVCKDGKCVGEESECGPQKACTAPKVCQDGKCVETGATCDAQNPCPTGQKCWKGQCAPDSYCEQESDCGFNQKCYRNRCGACSQTSDCPAHMECVQSECAFVKKQPGQECVDSSQCVQTAICMGDGSGKQYCRTKCDPSATAGCPSGEGCALLSDNKSGACVKKRGAGALTEGQACNPNQVQCEVDLVCVNDGGSNICMRLCNINQQNCVSGKKCISVGIDPIGVCEAGGSSGGGENSPCTSKAQCQSGMFCLRLPAGNGICTPSCDPANPVCSGGKVCDLIVDYQNQNVQAGVCGPQIAGLGEGKLCNYNYHKTGSCPPNQPQCLCRSDLFCILNLQNPSSGLCARPCNPTTKNCPAGQQCIATPLKYNGATFWGCI